MSASVNEREEPAPASDRDALAKIITDHYVGNKPRYGVAVETADAILDAGWTAPLGNISPPKLTPEIRQAIVRCEEEINAERMGEQTADVQMAFDHLLTLLVVAGRSPAEVPPAVTREQIEALPRFKAIEAERSRSCEDGPLLWRDEVLALFEKSAAVWRSAQPHD